MGILSSYRGRNFPIKEVYVLGNSVGKVVGAQAGIGLSLVVTQAEDSFSVDQVDSSRMLL